MSLELDRELAVQALASHFAQDHLTTQELELRFEKVYRAASTAELQALLGGLPALVPIPAASLAPAAYEALPGYSVAPAATVPREKRYLALMGEVRRKGTWIVPDRLHLFAAMGAIRLDLREAQIPAAGVEIDATALMGEVRIVLPPGLHAEVDGLAVMGEFSDRTAGAAHTLDAPVIRVRGMAFMGAVRVETRLPGEGVLEAWKRRLRGA
jgi:hypothetical protein